MKSGVCLGFPFLFIVWFLFEAIIFSFVALLRLNNRLLTRRVLSTCLTQSLPGCGRAVHRQAQALTPLSPGSVLCHLPHTGKGERVEG